MTLYKLCSWEDNGYHDSDFYDIFWDDEQQKVMQIMTGTTRFAGSNYPDNTAPLTEAIAHQALQWLEDVIHDQLLMFDKLDIDEPNKIKIDDRVKLIESHRNKAKEQTECDKCNGSGHWINPKNSDDKRECFACRGNGTLAGDLIKKDGKQVWRIYGPGTSGSVVWEGMFGAHFQKGYKQPCRQNISTRIKLDNGSIINVPLKKLSRDKAYMSPDEARLRAIALAKDCVFKAAFSRHGGWQHNVIVKKFADSYK